jgi:5-aminopentanamidase
MGEIMVARTIDVRAVQTQPMLGNVEHNIHIAEQAIEKAISDKIDLLVFPELFLTGYHVGKLEETVVEEAEEAISQLAGAATELTGVIGTVTKNDEKQYNSAAIIDQGEHIGTYHKTHLYGKEGTVFDAGSSFPIFDTSAGSLGVQICYDVEFPEVARQLTLAGAEILVTPLANMRPFQADQQVFGAVRALENIRPHVICNRVGEERGIEFFGASAIVDERGQPLVSAGEDTTIELTATVELQAEGVETLRYLDDRRPEIYDSN